MTTPSESTAVARRVFGGDRSIPRGWELRWWRGWLVQIIQLWAPTLVGQVSWEVGPKAKPGADLAGLSLPRMAAARLGCQRAWLVCSGVDREGGGMVADLDIARWRLGSQHLVWPYAVSAAQAVGSLLAV